MVGEIRDTETLRLAAQAALTGHLVISTLHTNSAPAAISRLHNLGLPKYLISATLKAVIAQRLVRCLCTDCAEQDQHSVECKSCAGTGYKGRTTIAEFLRFSEQTTAASDLDSLDAQQNLLNGVRLADDAQRLIDAGITDQAEVIRVLGLPNDSH